MLIVFYLHNTLNYLNNIYLKIFLLIENTLWFQNVNVTKNLFGIKELF